MPDEMRQCKGTTQQGEPCEMNVKESDYCRHHKDQAPGGEPEDAMTHKQKLFVEFYCSNGFNALKAYKQAGYSGESRSAPYELKQKPKVQAAIKQRMDDYAMDSEEALARLSEFGRATYDHFLDDDGFFSLQTEEAQRNVHLIKNLQLDQAGRVEKIELHDPKDAVKSIAKVHGELSDKHEHTFQDQRRSQQYDYSVLTDEELEELERITAKLEETIDETEE